MTTINYKGFQIQITEGQTHTATIYKDGQFVGASAGDTTGTMEEAQANAIEKAKAKIDLKCAS